MKEHEHLRGLRKRLGRLRRRRQRFRRATAASALVIAVLWALAGVFALDWSFERNVDLVQRFLLLALAAGGVVWAFIRFARPWLGKQEDVVDMALLVERQSGIDTDLVAALEFESDDAPNWGSPQLETAVIDRVADQQKHVDVMSAMPRQPLSRRLKVFAATAAVWVLLAVLAPGYVRVFFQRLAFGSQHYPSQTQLVALTVNGKTVDLSSSAGPRVPIHVQCGQTVRFEVTVAGVQPASGRVEISTQGRGSAVNVPLDPAPEGDADQAQTQYRAAYPGLNQSARYQVYLGDAWTDPLGLSVTPLPAVEIEVDVAPPAYARQSADELHKLPRGMRQFSVLAGSEVRLRLDSDRPLASAEMTIAGQSYPLKRMEASSNPDGADAAEQTATAKSASSAQPSPEIWTLPTAGTPLASVADEVAYSIQVHDPEGQTLDQPLEGSIAIEPDQPPAILATTKTPIVLPTGSPTIHYEAADDHALSSIWITWEATAGEASAAESRLGAQAGNASGDTSAAERREGRIDVCRFPLEALPKNHSDDYRLALESLPLKPGDLLKVTFHAADFRGPAAAATTDAEPPLVFQVTDLHGFEASMYEADQKSAGALEDIRRKHSGLGETQ